MSPNATTGVSPSDYNTGQPRFLISVIGRGTVSPTTVIVSSNENVENSGDYISADSGVSKSKPSSIKAKPTLLNQYDSVVSTSATSSCSNDNSSVSSSSDIDLDDELKLKEKKKVRFYPKVKCRRDVYGHDTRATSLKVKNECWYSRDEYDLMRDDCCLTIDLMDHDYHVPSNHTKICFRGLEGRTKEGWKKLRTRRSNLVRSVLDEQERLYLYDQCSSRHEMDEQIAYISRIYSFGGRADAIQKGTHDESVSKVDRFDNCPEHTNVNKSNNIA